MSADAPGDEMRGDVFICCFERGKHAETCVHYKPATDRRCGAAIHPTLGRCVRSDFHDGDHEATSGETWAEPVFRPILHRIIDMENEIAELKASLAAAREDTARLDALETWLKGDQILCSPGMHGGDVKNWLLSREYEERNSQLGQWCDEYEGPTLRAAIDAARTAAAPEGT